MTNAELLRRYRDALAGWGAACEAIESQIDAPAATELHDEQRRLYKELQETSEGRIGIVALMRDPNPWVRLAAATAGLQWVPGRAAGVLEELASVESLPW